MSKFIGNLFYFSLWIGLYFLALHSDSKTIDIVCCVVGFLGVLYVLYFLRLLFLCPIKRDLALISGKFLKKVITFVLSVPFIFSFVFIILDNCSNCTYSSYDAMSNLLIGDDNKVKKANKESHVFWTVYYHFIDPGNQHLAVDKGGRGLAALIAILGVLLLNGLLISTLINWFDNRKNLWAKGDVRYSNLAFRYLVFLRKKHSVVIGVDDNATSIIKNLLRGKGEYGTIDYVLVLTNYEVEWVRSLIYSHLDDDEQKRVIIYRGQLDAFEQMEALYLDRADEVYVLGDKQKEEEEAFSYHDIQNMKIVHNIASELTDKDFDHKLICRVLFEYQTTFSIFQFSDLPFKITDNIVFIPFNNYENWAQCVLVKGSYTEVLKKALPRQRKDDLFDTSTNNAIYYIIKFLRRFLKKRNDEERTFEYMPLDGIAGLREDDDKIVHFVVVGMSKMGIAMALQAAQIAHYPNFKLGNDRRTRITFIDSNADTEKDFFIGRFQNMFNLVRHRYLDLSGKDYLNGDWIDPINENSEYRQISTVGNKVLNFIDIEWEFIKGNLEKDNVRQYLKMVAGEAKAQKTIMTIAICRPLAHEAIAAAIYMPEDVYDSVQQIWVYQREASDMVANFTKNNSTRKCYEKIQPFGMSNADFTMDKENYYRAQLSNYVYSTISEDPLKNQRINANIAEIRNASHKEAMELVRNEWKKLNMANRWSNKYLANSFETKLRCLGYFAVAMNDYYDAVCVTIKKYQKAMAECEHNRWNLQQLLMGFRAYTNEELESYFSISGVDKVKRRDLFKKEKKEGVEKAHLNICSFEKLKEIDSEVMVYDEVFNAAIPDILRLTEKARLESMPNKKHKK